MTEGKRPGGLTALAVINFVFAGLGVLGIIGTVVALAYFSTVEPGDEQQREMKEAFEQVGMGMWIVWIGVSIVSTILIVIAGIGYLKQSKFLGKTIGNLWAALTVVTNALSALLIPLAVGGGFNLSTMAGLIYPVLTLFLLNFTFKDDFIN